MCFMEKTNLTRWVIFRTFCDWPRRFFFSSSLHTSAVLVFLKMSDSHPYTPPPRHTVTPAKINLNDVKIIISQII